MYEDKFLTNEFFKDQDMQYCFDVLTKVLNREMITTYLKYLIENKKPFTLCLCDVDNFKRVNDTYGHMTGDEVLYTVANLIVSSVNDKGLVGRYGGDEFMIILEGITEYNDVWSICHKINVAAAKLQFEELEDLHVTLTTGISRYPLDGANYEELLGTADKALYRGKMKGRNCFIIYLAAKHADIMLKSDKELGYNSMEMISRVFKILSVDREIKDSVSAVLRFLSTSLMVNHICIDSMNGICESIVHKLSNVKKFKHIDLEMLLSNMNSSGIAFVNQRRTLQQIGKLDYHKVLKEQSITSICTVKIECNGFTYGVLRAESATNRVWQSYEMDLFVTAAKLIGLLLYKSNLTLDDVYFKNKK